ncbi:winged helix-turn-helix domain-containing protein [Mesorhizobium sp. M1396]|uniref:AfsR/SARP family transcriptional regulator n=1 Tax=Mesorhizobium sp. M1396 TaxID=2957095 RepID=UPI00333D464B
MADSTAHPHLCLLGGFDFAGDAAIVPVLSRKARAMVAYLALQSGHSQSREKLAALLWGGNSDTQARMNLRQAVSAVRKAIQASGTGRFLAAILQNRSVIRKSVHQMPRQRLRSILNLNRP